MCPRRKSGADWSTGTCATLHEHTKSMARFFDNYLNDVTMWYTTVRSSLNDNETPLSRHQHTAQILDRVSLYWYHRS
jgi:hypothetical protein